MKNVVIITAAAVGVIIAGIVGCSNHKLRMRAVHTKVFTGVVKIEDPNSQLAKAKRDSIATYKKFRAEAITKLSHNISKISNYRSAIDTSKACANKVVCEQKADSLTNVNNELIVKLDNGKADKNWTTYKRKLKSDLDKLSFVVGGLTKPEK